MRKNYFILIVSLNLINLSTICANHFNPKDFEENKKDSNPSFQIYEDDTWCKKIPELSEIAVDLRVKNPFFIKKAGEFTYTTQIVLESFSQEKEVFCYGRDGKEISDISNEQILKDWKNNQLSVNITDTSITDVKNMDIFVPQALKDNSGNMCYIISGAKAFSKLHFDRPEGDTWMHIKEGLKIWWIILPEDIKLLENKGYSKEKLGEMDEHNLLHVLKEHLHGKVYRQVMEDNDFIFFPQGWYHCVKTLKKSIGVGASYFKNSRIF